MKVNIIPIGNSRGIRLPKAIIEQCHIGKQVDLRVDDDNIIIKSLHKKPRNNWDAAFKKMHHNRDDRLVMNDNLDLDMESWEWK